MAFLASLVGYFFVGLTFARAFTVCFSSTYSSSLLATSISSSLSSSMSSLAWMPLFSRAAWPRAPPVYLNLWSSNFSYFFLRMYAFTLGFVIRSTPCIISLMAEVRFCPLEASMRALKNRSYLAFLIKSIFFIACNVFTIKSLL